MALQVQDIDTEVDFPALARCLFESYEDPPQKFFHIFFPIHGTDDEAREEAIKEAAERLKLWHTQDPTSYWQKVVDTSTGKIAGGAVWNIYEENPFANPNPPAVTWFPAGGSRMFVEKALENHAGPRSRVAQKPHICEHAPLSSRTRLIRTRSIYHLHPPRLPTERGRAAVAELGYKEVCRNESRSLPRFYPLRPSLVRSQRV